MQWYEIFGTDTNFIIIFDSCTFVNNYKMNTYFVSYTIIFKFIFALFPGFRFVILDIITLDTKGIQPLFGYTIILYITII